MGNQLKSKDYDSFVEKFKPKKTTDDCYTPQCVMDEVVKYVHGIAEFTDDQIVRPFFPGGDYAHHDYPKDCIVIDNPPFSIYSKIVRFYIARDIRFFLFGPALTICVKGADVTYVIASASVIYANGANVNTSFVTNLLPEDRFVIAGTLRKCIEAAQRRERKEKAAKKLTRYDWDKHFYTPALVDKFSALGVDMSVGKNDCMVVDSLDCGVGFFGTEAFLLKDDAVEALKAEALKAEALKAEALKAEDDAVKVRLSRRELDMLENMPKYEPRKMYVPELPKELQHSTIMRQYEMDFGDEFFTPKGCIEDILESEKKGQEEEA